MDLEVYFRFLLALVFVLGLIAALAWAARRFGFGGNLMPTKGRSGRLAVTESLMLDAKRRLVLIRRDDREHLVLIGPAGETLIESGIAGTLPSASVAKEQP